MAKIIVGKEGAWGHYCTKFPPDPSLGLLVVEVSDEAVKEATEKRKDLFIDGAFVYDVTRMKEDKIKEAGEKYGKEKESVTWVTFQDKRYGYGKTESNVSAFMSAMKRAELGEAVDYNVYINEEGEKSLVPHTLDMFKEVLRQSAEDQVNAYKAYEQTKAAIEACQTGEEVQALSL